jgi:hypothetical protein
MSDADDASDELGTSFADAVGPEVVALLADPSMWDSPSSAKGDGIVDAIRSESGVDPGSGDADNVRSLSSRLAPLRPVLVGVAAAVILLVGGVVVFSALDGSGDEPEFSAAMESTGLEPDVAGEVTVTATQSGIRVDLEAASLPRRGGGLFYEGWLLVDDGTLVPIGTFHEADGVTLWAGIELDRVVAMTITREQAAEPASADQGSSGEVVLKVDFPTK